MSLDQYGPGPLRRQDQYDPRLRSGIATQRYAVGGPVRYTDRPADHNPGVSGEHNYNFSSTPMVSVPGAGQNYGYGGGGGGGDIPDYGSGGGGGSEALGAIVGLAPPALALASKMGAFDGIMSGSSAASGAEGGGWLSNLFSSSPSTSAASSSAKAALAAQQTVAGAPTYNAVVSPWTTAPSSVTPVASTAVQAPLYSQAISQGTSTYVPFTGPTSAPTGLAGGPTSSGMGAGAASAAGAAALFAAYGMYMSGRSKKRALGDKSNFKHQTRELENYFQRGVKSPEAAATAKADLMKIIRGSNDPMGVINSIRAGLGNSVNQPTNGSITPSGWQGRVPALAQAMLPELEAHAQRQHEQRRWDEIQRTEGDG